MRMLKFLCMGMVLFFFCLFDCLENEGKEKQCEENVKILKATCFLGLV